MSSWRLFTSNASLAVVLAASAGLLAKEELAAEQLPAILVEFICSEPVYCTKLSPGEINTLNIRLRKSLARRFGCFSFEAHAQGAGAYRLIVELHKLNRSEFIEQIDEVVFWLSLAEADGKVLSEPIPWAFRPRDEYNVKIEGPKTFEASLCLSFEGHLSNADRRRELTDKVLSKIPLADRAFPIPGGSDWAMPFSREETAIAEDSLFRVVCHFPVASGEKSRPYQVMAVGTTERNDPALPVDYRAKILGETLSPKGPRPNGLKAKAVHLVLYEPVSLPPLLAAHPTSPCVSPP